MAEFENGKCHPERAPQDSPPLIQHGKIVIQAHHIGWMVCSALTLVAMGVSFWLINKHLRWYTNKYEQRYIVRILFMVPLYAIISTASYFWWNHSTPLLLLRDCYESTVLTSFFYLILLYISPNSDEQKDIFRKNGLSQLNDRERRRRGEPVQRWMFPLGFLRWKPEDGLYFLQLMKWGVLQYCVVRPGTTLAAVILDYIGLYCEDSWSLGWGHFYITIVVSISVTISMYCLLQLYMGVKVELAPHRPLLKLFAIKAVVFLTFWQATFLSVLTLFGIVKDTEFMTANNINIGIGALAETFEMAIFACLHVKAFSYKSYCSGNGPTPRWNSLLHAMNFKETGRELWAGMVYMMRRSRGYEVDTQARREAALEDVFGRSRFAISREADESGSGKANASEKNLSVRVQVEKEVRVGEELQWLGVGDEHIYGLGYQTRRQRERSEGLESQIERELVRRGYTLRGATGDKYSPIDDADNAQPSNHHCAHPAWWRRMYNRLSQSGADQDVEGASPPDTVIHPLRRSSRQGSNHVSTRIGAVKLMADVQEDDYNDPPPPSAIRTYRESKNRNKTQKQGLKRSSLPALNPPLLFTSFGDIHSPLSSPEAHDDIHMAVPLPDGRPDHSALSLHGPSAGSSTPPLLTPSAQSSCADSFLDRAFAASMEPGSSAEVLSAGPPSSQSHHSRVRLASVPALVTQMKPQPKVPVVRSPTTAPSTPSPPRSSPQFAAYPATSTVFSTAATLEGYVSTGARTAMQPTSTPRSPPPARSSEPSWMADESRSCRHSSHRRDLAQFYPEPRNFSPPQHMTPSQRLPPIQQSLPRPSQAGTAASSRGLQRDSRTLQYPLPQSARYAPVNRYIPTRSQIVLPAPLAPASSGTPQDTPGGTQPTGK